MKKTWLDPKPVTVPTDVANAVEGHTLLAETLVRRGIVDGETARRFLDPDYYTPASPFDLPDMERAVNRLETAIMQGQVICVWGDFDVDGQTATAVLVSALRRLGATVRFYIPHRLKEGHGINLSRLDTLINDGVQLILTCDTGIAEHDAVDHANARGVDVIITDHHQLPPVLPKAYAAVNPQRLPRDHPLHTLPGVGCAYKLIEALYNRAGYTDELPAFLDLVALGIVADVAVQTGDARHTLQQGLDVLRQTKRLGLRALLEIAEISLERVNEETIGFSIAPRLNALGRLDDANTAVEFLTTDDEGRARILANQLDALNNERKHLSEQVFQAAQVQVQENPKLLDHAVLVLGHPNWPGGIIGIVANRLVEAYNRPVILLHTPLGELARGSARSIPGIDITAAIAAQAELLDGYGGHTMAAGLRLPQENIIPFRRAISRTVQSQTTEDRTPTLNIDAYIPLADVSSKLVEALDKLAPFGAGNPALTLATRKLTLKSHRQVGRTGKHMRLAVVDEQGETQSVVWWNADLDVLPKGHFDLAYTIGMNEYRGKISLQMTFVDARPVDEAPREFAHRSDVTVVDFRAASPAVQIDELSKLDDALIWNEGETIPDTTTVRRDNLRPAPTLVIWTAPPSADVLRDALEKVNPASVVLFGIDPGWDDQQMFRQRLAGLVKYTLRAKDGQTTFSALAGAMAHREATVRAGLLWMQARGQVTVTIGDDATVGLSTEKSKSDPHSEQQAEQKVGALLQETAAYRAYFKIADKNGLVQIGS
jgi:single-stranded-DNA-specific exonuclease